MARPAVLASVPLATPAPATAPTSAPNPAQPHLQHLSQLQSRLHSHPQTQWQQWLRLWLQSRPWPWHQPQGRPQRSHRPILLYQAPSPVVRWSGCTRPFWPPSWTAMSDTTRPLPKILGWEPWTIAQWNSPIAFRCHTMSQKMRWLLIWNLLTTCMNCARKSLQMSSF